MLVALNRIGRHVFQNRRICLDFAGAKLAQIVLHVVLVMVRVIRVSEITAAAGDQIIDPGQPMPLDEVGIEAEAIDDEVVGRTSRLLPQGRPCWNAESRRFASRRDRGRRNARG